jgi:hypothetical protein
MLFKFGFTGSLLFLLIIRQAMRLASCYCSPISLSSSLPVYVSQLLVYILRLSGLLTYAVLALTTLLCVTGLLKLSLHRG